MDSGDIAVAIADAFMEACLNNNPNDYLSQSVINLRAIPSLKNQLETYAAYLTDALENGQMPTISRLRQRMYAFGKFSDASSDQVDFRRFSMRRVNLRPTWPASWNRPIVTASITVSARICLII